jgi:hypothetical protein
MFMSFSFRGPGVIWSPSCAEAFGQKGHGEFEKGGSVKKTRDLLDEMLLQNSEVDLQD